MSLPQKKIKIFDGEEITIRALSCDQVEALLLIGNPDAEGNIDAAAAKERTAFVVKEGTGIDFSERKKTTLFNDYFNAFNEVHREILDLSGLKTAAPGEGLAVVEKSTSSDSAAA